MKISQAFRDAARTVKEQKGETLKFLALETAMTLMCLAPLLFLTQKGPLKYLAALALPLWLLVKVPARVNAAAAMQDSLGEGKIFSLRLADPGNYGRKVAYGLGRLGMLLLWGAPLIAALVYAWMQYVGVGNTDGLTVMQKIYEFGGKDTKTGMIYVLLILAALAVLALLGAGFHSGDRHAWVLDEKGLMKRKRPKTLLCRICSLVYLLPLIIAFVIVAFRYAPLLNDISGVLQGDVPKPNTKVTLAILGVGAALTLPLIPLRAMTTAAYVKGLRE
jgi:hypothetical protein